MKRLQRFGIAHVLAEDAKAVEAGFLAVEEQRLMEQRHTSSLNKRQSADVAVATLRGVRPSETVDGVEVLGLTTDRRSCHQSRDQAMFEFGPLASASWTRRQWEFRYRPCQSSDCSRVVLA